MAAELAKLAADTAIYVTHFKPRKVKTIMGQMAAKTSQRRAWMTGRSQVFEVQAGHRVQGPRSAAPQLKNER
jgi:hypothetical protein